MIIVGRTQGQYYRKNVINININNEGGAQSTVQCTYVILLPFLQWTKDVVFHLKVEKKRSRILATSHRKLGPETDNIKVDTDSNITRSLLVSIYS